tara:strand:+ start:405 stop:4289 length:3885 start_codon:yes stop_codon:yes gene_type:complete
MEEQQLSQWEIHRQGLINNPDILDKFNAVYGEGAGEKVLEQSKAPTIEPVSDNKIEPVSDNKEDKDDSEIWNTWEVIKSPVVGAMKAVDATGDYLTRFTGDINIPRDAKGDLDWANWKYHTPSEITKLQDEGTYKNVYGNLHDNLGVAEAKSVIGKGAEGISQFAVGFWTGGKIIQAAKVTAATIKGQLALGAVKGFSSDFLAFKGDEGNITEMLNSMGIDPLVYEPLLKDPDDSENEKRLKNALEGVVLGGAVDGLFAIVKGFAKLRKGKTEEAAELLEEGSETAGAAMKGAVDDAESTGRGWKTETDSTEPRMTDGQYEMFEETAEEAAERARRETELGAKYEEALESGENTLFKITNDIVDDLIHGAARIKEDTAQGIEESAAGDLFGVSRETVASLNPKDIFGRNLNAIDEPEKIAFVIRSLADKFREGELHGAFVSARGGLKKSWVQVQQQANGAFVALHRQYKGEDAAEFLKQFAVTPGSKDYRIMDAEVLARAMLLNRVAQQVDYLGDLAIRVADNVAGAEELARHGFASFQEFDNALRMQIEIFANIENLFLGQQAAVGRALRIMAKVNKAGRAPTHSEIVEIGTSRSALLAYIKKRKAAQANGTKLPTASNIGSFWDRLNSFRINMMLSGPNTQIINFNSNIIQQLTLISEQMLGGAARSYSAEGRQEFLRGAHQLYYTFAYMGEALEMAGKAAKYDRAFLDSMGGKIEMDGETMNVFGGDKLHFKSKKEIRREGISLGYKGRELKNYISTESKRGRNVRGAANLLATVPSRLLLTSDEFFKQTAFRAKVHADLYAKGKQKGLSGNDLKNYIKENFKKAVDETGSAAINGTDDAAEAARAALDFSREATFTTELDGFFAKIQALAVQYPAIRFILPFVKTPTNLLLATFDRMPVVNLFHEKYREQFFSKDPNIRAAAMGKMLSGIAVGSTAAVLASTGTITGSGPNNPKTKAAWMATGWRPYSVRVQLENGDTAYISYQRFEPFGNFLGIAADVFETVNEAELEGLNPNEESYLISGMLTAAVENTINKTYMRGLSDTLTAFAKPEPYTNERTAAAALASFLPNVISQTNGDEALRETRGMLDQIKSRLQSDLGTGIHASPKRNAVGEVILRQTSKWHPFDWSVQNKQDVVLMELANQGYVSNRPHAASDNRLMGTFEDFSKIEYKDGQSILDRFLELSGTITPSPGGPNLREALDLLISDPAYNTLPIGSRDNPDSPRNLAIARVIKPYREAAKSAMLQEGLTAPEGSGLRKFYEEFNKKRIKKYEEWGQYTPKNLHHMLTGKQ